PVRLRVQLVEDHAVGIEAVLVCHIGGEHLVEAVRRQVFMYTILKITLMKPSRPRYPISENM
ncbi:MAG: hypothetical protein ACOX7O_09725, partial [Oscillospiraceae bacterium]